MDKKFIVIYSSKYGTTKGYAERVADALGCDAVPADACDFGALSDFDCIVYGGWIRGGGIVGLNRLKPHAAEIADRLVIFATGISTDMPTVVEEVKGVNFDDAIKDVPLVLCGGKYDPKTASAFDKMLMGIAKMIVKGKDENGAKMKNRLNVGSDLREEDGDLKILKEVEKITGLHLCGASTPGDDHDRRSDL